MDNQSMTYIPARYRAGNNLSGKDGFSLPQCVS